MKTVKAKKIRVNKPEKTSGKGMLINIAVTALFALAHFYVSLPPINLRAQEFYTYFLAVAAVYFVSAVVTSGFIRELQDKQTVGKSIRSRFKVVISVCAVLVIVLIVGNLFSGVLFWARSYSDIIEVDRGDFASEVAEISFDSIPLLDRDSARKLGDRKLGELSDMVSQFEVANNYTQINYKNRPVRVTPLEYGDIIKWFNNRKQGIPAYITIDMVTQNVEVVRLEQGMKYMPTEHFSRNLHRHLRFRYPTYMFETPEFELDEQGVPYWVCPRVVKTIGVFGGKDIRGAVLVNAITGECQYHEDIPTWVDRVYPAELIIEQYDYHGQYASGFLNAMFGQRGVTVTTDGYNYIAMNDDVYMYTGITSVGGDESNIGFILSNLRTRHTTFYEVAGAEEYSAMSSAEGVVQHLGYHSTFPLLLNISGEPTYFMALKDDAGLVKMYAMVNVRQYQIVATATTVAGCESNYMQLLAQNNLTEKEHVVGEEITGAVQQIRSAVIEGNTVFYFKLEGSDKFFAVSADMFEIAVTVDVGDVVRISYVDTAGDIAVVTGFEVVTRTGGPVDDPPVTDEAVIVPEKRRVCGGVLRI